MQFPLLAAATLRTLIAPSGRSLAPGDPAPQALRAPDGQPVAAGAPLPSVGVYRGADDQPALAVSILDPAATDLTAQPRPRITVSRAPATASAQPAGRPIWPWLVSLVVIGLSLEAAYRYRGRLPQLVRR